MTSTKKLKRWYKNRSNKINKRRRLILLCGVGRARFTFTETFVNFPSTTDYSILKRIILMLSLCSLLTLVKKCIIKKSRKNSLPYRSSFPTDSFCKSPLDPEGDCNDLLETSAAIFRLTNGNLTFRTKKRKHSYLWSFWKSYPNSPTWDRILEPIRMLVPIFE